MWNLALARLRLAPSILLQAQESDHCLLLPLTYPKRRGLLETPGKYCGLKYSTPLLDAFFARLAPRIRAARILQSCAREVIIYSRSLRLILARTVSEGLYKARS
jgi:hypothetical protein